MAGSVLGGTVRERQRNQPNGFAGLDSNGDLLGTLVNRSMTYDELMNGEIPEAGELVYCTDTRDLHVGDGSTVGGLFLTAPTRQLTLSNLGVSIGDAGELEVASFAAKANCQYLLEGFLVILDTDVTSNNARVKYTSGDVASNLTALPAPTLWTTPVPSEGFWATNTSSGIVTTASPIASPILSFQQSVYLRGRVANTTDVTASVWVKQQVANGIIQLGSGSLTVRRVK